MTSRAAWAGCIAIAVLGVAADLAKPPTADMAPSAGIYKDFRNSRFDIQQKFAEGFDPDRIAVAFANDLASTGERRLVSGLTPAFSIR